MEVTLLGGLASASRAFNPKPPRCVDHALMTMFRSRSRAGSSMIVDATGFEFRHWPGSEVCCSGASGVAH